MVNLKHLKTAFILLAMGHAACLIDIMFISDYDVNPTYWYCYIFWTIGWSFAAASITVENDDG